MLPPTKNSGIPRVALRIPPLRCIAPGTGYDGRDRHKGRSDHRRSGRVFAGMILAAETRKQIAEDAVKALHDEREVRRIVIIGSFTTSDSPNDIDVAVFQDSEDGYLQLALKYRRKMRSIAARLPVDVVPVSPRAATGAPMMAEIMRGPSTHIGAKAHVSHVVDVALLDRSAPFTGGFP